MRKWSSRVAGALGAAALLLSASQAFGASVVVPTMELITHGSPSAGGFVLETYANLALSIEGGYKFGGSIVFGVPYATSLETMGAGAAALELLSASMTVRNAFKLPVNLTYFYGLNDVLCSGDGFTQFGVTPIMTDYRGFLSFPTGPLYDGMYRVEGTGLHVQVIPKVETSRLDLYVYQDLHGQYPGNGTPLFSGLGNWSADLRLLLNLSPVRIEAFLGGTLAPSAAPNGLYRGGLLFHMASKNLEFLAQAGIPLWDTATDPLPDVNSLYLLVEPRLHLGAFNLVPTFFWHPGGYMQALNPAELGSFDVNLNMYVGDTSKDVARGGVEGNLRFKSSTGEIVVKASPWIGFTTPGILWTMKVTAKVFPFNLSDMLEGFVGIRAAF